jgi:predicted kinase
VAQLVVFVGLPASGKSAFYQARFAATHLLVSKDLMPNVPSRGERQRQLVRAALARGQSVVVDNTNVRRADRDELLAIARAAGAATAVYHFTAPPSACVARNRARSGKARVPDVAIFAARKRLEPPAADEGFDARYEVALAEATRDFVVTDVSRSSP